ncbi:hypothetical protein V1517DRAFT_335157 [Lipomyces orientalis]|uniref:Uncharacterized protein n=1 Tax=Lipomyces orientalis TaxID=1233043 RepID=A0ACC3TYY7_9ASCO
MTLAPDPRTSRPHGGGVHYQAPSSSASSAQQQSTSTTATSAPVATSTAPAAAPPVCQNCATSTTPLWRRDESGQVLCNACGLFLKLHGRARPISLKTDVIKSRNRIKNPHHAGGHGHGHGHGHGQTNGSGAGASAPQGSASSANGTGVRKKHESHTNNSNASPGGRPEPASEADAGGLMHLAQALHVQQQQQQQQQQHDSRMMQQSTHLPSLSAAIKEESSPSMLPARGSPIVNAQGPHHLLAPVAGPVSPLLPLPRALGPSDMLTPPENSPPVVPQIGQQQRQQLYDSRSPALPLMQTQPPHLSSQAQGSQHAVPSPGLLPLPHASTPHAPHSSTPLGDPATPPSASLPPLVRRGNTPPHLSLAGQHEHEISPLVPAKSAIALAQARGHSPPATLAPIVKPTSTPPSVHSSVAPANAALSGSTAHTTMESLVTANQTLRTRVSELELVNDLFRSRISELESNEASARKSELTRRELETQLQRKLEESGQKNMELQSRVEELEIEKERLAVEREKMKLREQQLMQLQQQPQQHQQQQQQNQLLHSHLHHQLPPLTLPQTPASPAQEGTLEDSESQHMRKKMRVSDLVGMPSEAGSNSATPPQPPHSASRTGTPLQQILSPQASHHQSHPQQLIPPLQLSPTNSTTNGGYSSALPAVINGVNGLNRMSLPSVSSITLPPITAPGDSSSGSAR